MAIPQIFLFALRIPRELVLNGYDLCLGRGTTELLHRLMRPSQKLINSLSLVGMKYWI